LVVLAITIVEGSKFFRAKLEEVTEILVRTAIGRDRSDLVIKAGNLVNVNSGELLGNVDVAIKRGRIALIGRADHTIGNKTAVIDAAEEAIAACEGFTEWMKLELR